MTNSPTRNSGCDKADWLHQMFDHATSIQDIGRELGRLASAFQLTGNQTLADDLYHFAKALESEANLVRSLTGEKVQEDLRATQQSTVNMMDALLVGRFATK